MRTRYFALAVLIGTLATLFGCGGGTQSSGGGTQNKVPVIASISPTKAPLAGASFALGISGSNFDSGSIAYWGQTKLDTSYSSPAGLTAKITSDLLNAAGTYNITVVNPGSSGGTSGAVVFTVENPVPTLTSISPVNASMGSSVLTLTATGSGFQPNSQLQWNGTALTTTYSSATQLTAQVPAANLAAAGAFQITIVTPAPGGGASRKLGFTVDSTATRLQTLPIYAHDIVWDSHHGAIYASHPSTGSSDVNTVMVIDPVAGTVLKTMPMGAQPNQLAVSEDGSYLWVGQDGNNSVQRFLLPAFTPDISLTLPAPNPGDLVLATSIVAAPDNPHTLAVLSDTGIAGAVSIYDDSVPRGNAVSLSTSKMTALQWGANSSVLYGVDSETTAFALYDMPVNPSGVTMKVSYSNLFPGFVEPFSFVPNNGYLYGGKGYVADPATGSRVGAFILSDFANNYLTLPDPSHGVFFVLGQSSGQFPYAGFTLEAFDLNTFGLLRSTILPDVCGLLTNLIAWGNSGLAFTTSDVNGTCNSSANLYLLDGSFVNPAQPPDTNNGQGAPALPNLTSISPQSAAVGFSNLTFTVSGSNFEPGAVIVVDGTPFDTVVQSSTQLQAVISSVSLPVGTHSISVANGDAVSLSSRQLYFTVFPSSNTFALNLNALDVAWDKSSGLLYAAVWSLDPRYPNSIVAIDPATGQVVKSKVVGGNPYIVRPSDDGAYLYVGFHDANSVERLTLPDLSSDLSWSLGADAFFGPHIAMDIEPAPGLPKTTAVSTGNLGLSVSALGGVTIFDDNVPRPVKSANFNQGLYVYDSIQWGQNASSLYGYDVETTPCQFYLLNVDSSGVTNNLSQDAANCLGRIHYDRDTGSIFSDGGQVFSASDGKQIGTLRINGNLVSGRFALDSNSNQVFALVGNAPSGGAYLMYAFNKTSLIQTASLSLPKFLNAPSAMVRIGSSGFAIACYQPVIGLGIQGPGQLYIINSPTFTNSPASGLPVTGIVNRTEPRP